MPRKTGINLAIAFIFGKVVGFSFPRLGCRRTHSRRSLALALQLKNCLKRSYEWRRSHKRD